MLFAVEVSQKREPKSLSGAHPVTRLRIWPAPAKSVRCSIVGARLWEQALWPNLWSISESTSFTIDLNHLQVRACKASAALGYLRISSYFVCLSLIPHFLNFTFPTWVLPPSPSLLMSYPSSRSYVAWSSHCQRALSSMQSLTCATSSATHKLLIACSHTSPVELLEWAGCWTLTPLTLI